MSHSIQGAPIIPNIVEIQDSARRRLAASGAVPNGDYATLDARSKRLARVAWVAGEAGPYEAVARFQVDHADLARQLDELLPADAMLDLSEQFRALDW